MGSVGITIIVLIITCVVWLVVSNLSTVEGFISQSHDPDAVVEIPLHNVFHEFKHESTKAWLKWIDGQDESKKQFAYDKLIAYLDLPPKKLGAITGDVVKAVIVFKKKADAFTVLTNLLTKTRDHFNKFKSVDMFYETAAIGLTKMDHEKAEQFLIEELQQSQYREDLIPIQKYLIKALGHLEFTPILEKCWVSILTSAEYPEATKKELFENLETKSDKIRERIYLKIFKEQISSTASTLNNNDTFVIGEVFHKLTKLITKEDYDLEIWQAMSDACEAPRLRELIIQLLADMITLESDSLSQNQLLELINKKDPARTKFLEACSKKYKLSPSELELLRKPFNPEDLIFQKTRLSIEKSKRTKNIAHELLGDYHYLEKMMLTQGSGNNDKSGTTISVILGTGENEKFYLFRAYAANHNKSFAYVNVEEILSADGMVKEFKNHIANVKPCLIYLDNMEKVLNTELEKKAANNLKTITKSIKDLSILPSLSFVANIPHSKETLQRNAPSLLSKFTNSATNLYGITMNKEKPGEKEVAKIIQTHLEKIEPSRIEASEAFVMEDLITHAEGMDSLQLVQFLHQYFEICLLTNGELISMEEFNDRWQGPAPGSDEKDTSVKADETLEVGKVTEATGSTETVLDQAPIESA